MLAYEPARPWMVASGTLPRLISAPIEKAMAKAQYVANVVVTTKAHAPDGDAPGACRARLAERIARQDVVEQQDQRHRHGRN